MRDTKDVLKAKIQLLTMLSDRECSCDKSKCAEHFEYMRKLRYEYECQLESYEEEFNSSH